MNRRPRFCNVEARRQGIGATVITTSVTAAAANETNSNSKPPSSSAENSAAPSKDAIAHPLAAPLSNPLMDGGGLNNDGGGRTPTPPLPAGEAFKLQPVTATNIAARLTPNDVDRIRILVRE